MAANQRKCLIVSERAAAKRQSTIGLTTKQQLTKAVRLMGLTGRSSPARCPQGPLNISLLDFAAAVHRLTDPPPTTPPPPTPCRVAVVFHETLNPAGCPKH